MVTQQIHKTGFLLSSSGYKEMNYSWPKSYQDMHMQILNTKTVLCDVRKPRFLTLNLNLNFSGTSKQIVKCKRKFVSFLNKPGLSCAKLS